MKILFTTILLVTSLGLYADDWMDSPESDYQVIRDNAADTHEEQSSGYYDKNLVMNEYRKMRNFPLHSKQ